MRWSSAIADNRVVDDWVTLEAPARLPPRRIGSGGFFFVLFFGAAVAAIAAIAASRSVPGAWVAILLATAAFVWYALFIRSKGARIVLSAAATDVAAGEPIRVRCEVRGGGRSWVTDVFGQYLDEGWRPRERTGVELYLEGHEEMTLHAYDSEVFRDEFLSQSLGQFDATAPVTVSVRPPDDGMPTVSGKNFRVFWVVRAETHGWRPPWPISGTVYGELTVLPARARRG
jgi:hypothetical protein